MERVIKFRGISKKIGEFIYGIPTFDFTHIFNSEQMDSPDNYEVIPKTIGQFTGLTDKNGIEIYEGDLVKFVGGTCSILSMNHYGKFYDIGAVFKVSCLLSGFTLQNINANMSAPNLVGNISNYDFWNHQKSFNVIGSIHQNPELLT